MVSLAVEESSSINTILTQETENCPLELVNIHSFHSLENVHKFFIPKYLTLYLPESYFSELLCYCLKF